jgi:hypothetical protein
MIRIDENTYIDDTLVTCAEYQLFIDEMREQGQYYQPDHWTSYQFPKGQAREPILGVRQIDAQAFCYWLAERETNEWSYRLPVSTEAVMYSLDLITRSSIGYWTTGANCFSWASKIEHDDTNFAKDMVYTASQDRNIRRLFLDYINDISDDLIDLTRPIDLDQMLLRIFNIRSYIVEPSVNRRELNRSIRDFQMIKSGRTYSLNVAHKVDNISDLIRVLAKNFIRKINKSYTYPNLARDLIEEIHQVLVFDRSNIPTNIAIRDIKHEVDLVRDLVHLVIQENTLDASKRHVNYYLYLCQQEILSIYLDILMFQERIAGRSPAFEGIRLVKERIKP